MCDASLCRKQLQVFSRNATIVTITDFEASFDGRRIKDYKIKLIFAPKEAINSFFSPPKLWTRFVDDTFVIIKSDMVQNFSAHINSIEASIKFTIEYEKEDILPFLDILVMKKKGGILATKIYRKETHTNRYLNYESCHSQQQKQGVIISLLNRAAKLITDSKDFKKEKEMLRRALEDNNYPNWLTKKTFNQFKFSKIENTRKKQKLQRNSNPTLFSRYN